MNNRKTRHERTNKFQEHTRVTVKVLCGKSFINEGIQNHSKIRDGTKRRTNNNERRQRHGRGQISGNVTYKASSRT